MQTSVLRPTWLCLSLTFKVFAKDCILLSSPSRSAAVSILRFGQNQSNYLQNSGNCCSCTDFEVEKLNEGEKCLNCLRKSTTIWERPVLTCKKCLELKSLGPFLFITGWVMDCFLLLATFYTMNFDKGQQKSRRIMGSKRRREKKKTLDLYTFPIKGKKPRRSIRFFAARQGKKCESQPKKIVGNVQHLITNPRIRSSNEPRKKVPRHTWSLRGPLNRRCRPPVGPLDSVFFICFQFHPSSSFLYSRKKDEKGSWDLCVVIACPSVKVMHHL